MSCEVSYIPLILKSCNGSATGLDWFVRRLVIRERNFASVGIIPPTSFADTSWETVDEIPLIGCLESLQRLERSLSFS